MKPSIIQYDPYLSIEEIRKKSDVTAEAVRQYIKRHRIDRKCDDDTIKYRKVKNALREHPEKTQAELAESVGMSVGTFRKFAKMENPPQPSHNKVSLLNPRERTHFVSVSDSQHRILHAILSKHLNHAFTFDCDLTFGKGRFYSTSIPIPRFIYDLYPNQDRNVKRLEEAINLPNRCFDSVVIDLPCSVVRPSLRRRQPNPNSFDTLDQLYDSYKEMIALAHRLLKSGGILVFKTTDFKLDNKPIWISDWSIATATNPTLGFSLVDKYIYIDTDAIGRITSSARQTKAPDHAYFLVFKKQFDV